MGRSDGPAELADVGLEGDDGLGDFAGLHEIGHAFDDQGRKTDGEGVKQIARNRRAYHEYEILDTWEAGIALLGTEVKALRDGRVNLGEPTYFPDIKLRSAKAAAAAAGADPLTGRFRLSAVARARISSGSGRCDLRCPPASAVP